MLTLGRLNPTSLLRLFNDAFNDAALCTASTRKTAWKKQATLLVRHVGRSGTLVEVVNVLRNDVDGKLGVFADKCRDRLMTRIGLRLHRFHAPPFVPTPYQRRIGLEALSRSQALGIKALPKTG